MIDKEEYRRAWNAAVELTVELDIEGQFSYAEAEGSFDEWYERNVANPPEGWDDHHD